MNETRKSFEAGPLVGGLICITLGVLFLIDQLRLADFGDLVSTYWPMILVAIGLPKLFSVRSLWSGLWLISIGFWMQAVKLHWGGLTWNNSWPLLLILAGAGMVLRTFTDSIARRNRVRQ